MEHITKVLLPTFLWQSQKEWKSRIQLGRTQQRVLRKHGHQARCFLNHLKHGTVIPKDYRKFPKHHERPNPVHLSQMENCFFLKEAFAIGYSNINSSHPQILDKNSARHIMSYKYLLHKWKILYNYSQVISHIFLEQTISIPIYFYLSQTSYLTYSKSCS